MGKLKIGIAIVGWAFAACSSGTTGIGEARAPHVESEQRATTPAEAPAEQPKAPVHDRLEGPWFFDIELGHDSPEVVASKLGLALGESKCDEVPEMRGRAPTSSRYCWRKPPLRGVDLVILLADDVGQGLVVHDISFRHARTQWDRVRAALLSEYGTPDKEGDGALEWGWGHTSLELHEGGECEHGTCSEAILSLTHLPNLHFSDSQTKRASEAMTIASPWGLKLGYDLAPDALSKLKQAGFRLQFDCRRRFEKARSFAVRDCSLEGGPLGGLQRTTLQLLADSEAERAYGLVYMFELEAWDRVIRELTEQYGPPQDGLSTTPSWWLGPIGIEVLRTESFFNVSYFHGRVRALSYRTMYESLAAENELEKQGF